MDLVLELGGLNDSAKLDERDFEATRRTIAQYMAAGILFPEEIRNAERIIRQLNIMTRSSGVDSLSIK